MENEKTKKEIEEEIDDGYTLLFGAIIRSALDDYMMDIDKVRNRIAIEEAKLAECNERGGDIKEKNRIINRLNMYKGKEKDYKTAQLFFNSSFFHMSGLSFEYLKKTWLEENKSKEKERIRAAKNRAKKKEMLEKWID